MDTLLFLCPLFIALIPLGMALRALMTAKRPADREPYRYVLRGDSNPSLATSMEMEDTAPVFVKRNEWWTE